MGNHEKHVGNPQPRKHQFIDERRIFSRRYKAKMVKFAQTFLSSFYDGVFDLDVHAIPGRHDEPPHSHFDIRFLFRAKSAVLEGPDEVRDVRWVPLDAVADLTDDASVLRVVEKLRTPADV